MVSLKSYKNVSVMIKEIPYFNFREEQEEVISEGRERNTKYTVSNLEVLGIGEVLGTYPVSIVEPKLLLRRSCRTSYVHDFILLLHRKSNNCDSPHLKGLLDSSIEWCSHVANQYNCSVVEFSICPAVRDVRWNARS